MTKTKLDTHNEKWEVLNMMGMMKKKTNLLSPSSLAIHAIGIGAAIWLGKAWGRKTEDF